MVPWFEPQLVIGQYLTTKYVILNQAYPHMIKMLRLKWFTTYWCSIHSLINRKLTHSGLFRPDLLLTRFRLITFGLEKSSKVL